jgi:transposase-like protein
MYVQGVSTRKVKAITEELCGHSFSAAAISAINVKLDEGLAEFARRRLDEACPYLILDARYERVREAGVIRSQAVLLAIGIGWDGRRSILAVELANRESRSSWRDFLLELRQRGLSGVEFVVSDDHAGLKQAIVEVLPEAAWQRCYVGLLKKAAVYDPLLPDVVSGGEGSSRCWVAKSAGRRSCSLPDRFVTCCPTIMSWSESTAFSISAGYTRRWPSSTTPRPDGRASIPRLPCG